MKKVYFASDLHLGATYEPQAREKEHRIVQWIESIADDCAHLYLVGDVLDYWFEYRTVVPRGYIRFFGALARLHDRGAKITWVIGNHDIWLFDYLRDEIGIEVVDGILQRDSMGKRFLIAHGDGQGEIPRGFRFIRSVFRNRVCQKLYSAIHPRWTIPMAHAWSNSSRRKELSTPPFRGNNEPLLQFARQQQHLDPSLNFIIMGHRHLMVDIEIAPECRFMLLGDWLENDSYAMYDGETMKLISLKNKATITEV